MIGRARAGSPSVRDRFVLFAMCLATVISAGGATMVNVALPRIAAGLHVGYSDLQWIANVYTVVVATLVLPATTLAGNLGRRRTFCAGMSLVVAGSLISAAAPNFGTLLGGRFLQATGAAVVGPTSLGILAHQFTDSRARARAIGMWAGGAGIGLAVGPLAAGVLIGSLGWPSAFWTVGVIGLAVGGVAWFSISEQRHGRPATRVGIDSAGAGAIAVTLGAVSFGFIEARAYGWASGQIVGSFCVTAVGLVLFTRIELRRLHRHRPVLMPLKVWRHPRFAAANVGGAVFFFALYGLIFLYSVYDEQILHYSPFATGIAFVPMTASMAILAVLAGRMVAAVGVRVLTSTGLVISTAGATTLVTASQSVTTLGLGARFAILGIGFGLVSAPLTVTAVSALPAELTGIASSIYNAMRQVGAVMGVAVLGAIATADRSGASQGVHEAVIVTAALLLVSAAVLAYMLRQQRPAETKQQPEPAAGMHPSAAQ
jgi:MFS transporter, DHA2 family, methylenomycin A resistance protein